MNMAILWVLVPALPLFAAATVLRWPDQISRWSWLLVLPAFLATAIVPQTLVLDFLWPGAQWGVDSFLQRVLLGFTAVLWMFAGLFASDSLRHDARRRRFWLFWLLTLSGNLLLIIAGDALSFYVGFSMMSLAAYGLVVHKGGPQPRKAGRLYLQIAITGELLLFTGLIMASHQADGSMALSDWRTATMSPMALILLFLGLGLKAGFFPLHVWLPQAHPVAPAPASAVLSGAMIKAGILGMWQMMPATSEQLQSWAEPLLFIGLFSAFYGVALGLTRRDVKQVLAYSSVSQMGYLLFITALLWHQALAAPALATLLALYVVHHGFCKGALFMSAELLKNGRAATIQGQRLLLAVTALPALAVAGLPLTSGAAVKTLLKDQASEAALHALVLPLQVGAVASALIMLRAVILLKQMSDTAPARPLPSLQLFAWGVPALLCLLLPWIWPSMREAVLLTLPLYKLWDLSWPLSLGALLTATALALRWQVPAPLVRMSTPFLYMSLRLRQLLQRPPIPGPKPAVTDQHWRHLERRWNRFWARSTVNYTAWLITAVLLAAGISTLLRTV